MALGEPVNGRQFISVILPAAVPGIITGIILGMARAMSEVAAAILFFFCWIQHWPSHGSQYLMLEDHYLALIYFATRRYIYAYCIWNCSCSGGLYTCYYSGN